MHVAIEIHMRYYPFLFIVYVFCISESNSFAFICPHPKHLLIV